MLEIIVLIFGLAHFGLLGWTLAIFAGLAIILFALYVVFSIVKVIVEWLELVFPNDKEERSSAMENDFVVIRSGFHKIAVCRVDSEWILLWGKDIFTGDLSPEWTELPEEKTYTNLRAAIARAKIISTLENRDCATIKRHYSGSSRP